MSYMPYQYPAQQRPPYPVQPQATFQHPQPGYPVHPASLQQYTRPPQPVQTPIQPRQPAPRPPVKESNQFPQLQKLSAKELQAVLDNEDKVNEIVKDLEMITKEKLTKEMCLAENRSLAEFNLSREPRLTEGRHKLARSYEKNQQLRETFEQNMSNLTILSSNHSLDTVLALLQASASQAEDEAEEIADRFLDGNIEVDDFVEEFRAKRIVYNLKKTKSEELKKLIQPEQTAPYQTTPYQQQQAPYSVNQGYQQNYTSNQYMPRHSMPTIASYPR